MIRVTAALLAQKTKDQPGVRKRPKIDTETDQKCYELRDILFHLLHCRKTERLTEICTGHSTNILVLYTISLQTFLSPIHIQCVTSQMRAELCYC